MNDRTVLVVVDIDHHPILAGRLHMRARRGRQSASFEYDARWLSYPGSTSGIRMLPTSVRHNTGFWCCGGA